MSNDTIRIPLPAETSGTVGINSAGRRSSPGAQAAAPQAPAVTPAPPATSPAVPAPTNLTSQVVVPAPQAPAPKAPKPQAQSTSMKVGPDGKLTPADPFSRPAPVAKEPVVAKEPDPGNEEIKFDESDDDFPDTHDDIAKKAADEPVEAEVAPDVAPEVEAPNPAFGQPAGRDYSVFDPEDVEVLKKLPNAQFDKVKAIALDRKAKTAEIAELKARPTGPEHLYEHPESYVLHPKFGQLLAKSEECRQLEAFYERQILAAAEANDIQFLDGNNNIQTLKNEDGRVNVQAQLYLQKQYNSAVSEGQQVNHMTRQFQAEHQAATNAVHTQLDEAEKKFFPTFDEKTLTEAERQIYEQSFSLAPEVLRHTQQTRMLSKARLEYFKLAAASQVEINALKSKLAALTTKPGAPALRVAKPTTAGDELIKFQEDDDD